LDERVPFDQDDFHKAEIKLEVAEELAPIKAKEAEREQQEKQAETFRTKQGEMVNTAHSAGNHLWKQLGEGFEGIIKEDGSIDKEALSKLPQEDRAEAVAAATHVEAMAQELFMLDHGFRKYQGGETITEHTPEEAAQVIRAHRKLSDFATEREKAMMQRDSDARLDNEGRAFLPRAKYNALSADKRADYWTFSTQDLSMLYAKHISKEAKKRMEAAAKGDEDEDEQPRSRGNARPAARTNERDEKPSTPSIAPAPRLASRRGKGDGGPKTTLESWVQSAI